MEVIFILIVCLIGLITGLYMIYSGIYKNKGIQLPEKGIIGIFLVLKQGQEWVLFIIGVVWTVIWALAIGAILFDW